MKKLVSSVVFTAATLSFCTAGFAAGDMPMDDGSGFVTGVQVGYVDTHWDDIHENAFANFEIKVDDDDDVGVRPYIGYAINHYFQVELGYTYLGDARISRFLRAAKRSRCITKIKNYAFDNTFRFNAEFTPSFGVFGRVGVAYLVSQDSLNWRVTTFLPFNEDPRCRNSSNFAVTYGAGLYYKLTPLFTLEFAWTHYRGDSEANDSYQPSPDFFSMGISYRWRGLFG